jgi:hypothetical protein
MNWLDTPRRVRGSHRRGARIGALATALAAAALIVPAGAGAATQSFTTPGSSSFVVPTGVTSVSVEAFGAAGGASGDGKAGGLGAEAKASTVAVTGGETLSVVVGGRGGNGVNGTPLEVCDWGAGGVNGGGEAGECDGEGAAAGGGGGASEVRRGATALVLAGGGGGAGANGTGGAGGAGGETGVAGTAGAAGGGGGGGGGTATTGGAGGAGQGGGQAGKVGTSHTGGEGGFWSDASGGGGGGGVFGGGGGGGSQNFSGGGGGGGSSTGPTGTVFTTGAQSGNGKVVISYAFTPSVTTTASAGVTIGGQVHATSVIAAGHEATGTIEFALYAPGDTTCTGTPAFTATKTVTAAATTYESGNFTPTAAGTYHWTASYSGDFENTPAASSCTEASAATTISSATPSVTTTSSAGVTIGGQVHAASTIAAGHEATGTIEFALYAPGDTTCTGTPAFTATKTVTAAATTYESGNFTPIASGTYHWVASYSGDTNNKAAASSCGEASAAVAVGTASPSLTTTSSAGVGIGGQVHATASLAGGDEATGTIEFALYAPGDTACTGTPVFTETKTVTAASTTYESGMFTPAAAGTYRWVAEYSGDGNNDGAESPCAEASAAVAVASASPSLTVASSAGITVGGQVHATATLAGGHEASGMIAFALYGPDDATCTGTPIFAETVNVKVGTGAYESAAFTPTAAGTYRWIASYSGDGNNEAVASSCANASAAVTVASKPTPTPTPAPETKKTEATPTPMPSAPATTVTTPTVTVLHSPNKPHQPNPKGGPRWTFTFKSGMAGVTYYCQMDNGPFKRCTSPVVYRNLAKGKHVFKVKSVDATGKVSPVNTEKFTVGRKAG